MKGGLLLERLEYDGPRHDTQNIRDFVTSCPELMAGRLLHAMVGGAEPPVNGTPFDARLKVAIESGYRTGSASSIPFSP